MTILWLGGVVFFFIAAAFAYLIRQLLARPKLPEFESGWVEHFSLRKYRPMERLLDNRDLAFVSSLAGAERRIVRKLKRDRQKIRRAYLRSVRRDFDRLCVAGRIIALYSSEDRPELTMQLLRLQIAFHFALCRAWLQVGLSTMGLGTVDLGRVVRPVAMLHAQLAPAAVTG